MVPQQKKPAVGWVLTPHAANSKNSFSLNTCYSRSSFTHTSKHLLVLKNGKRATDICNLRYKWNCCQQGVTEKVSTDTAHEQASQADSSAQYVYSFSPSGSEGNGKQADLLGGKGANLAEMCDVGLPVPPGFTITTEVCNYYYANDKSYPPVGVHLLGLSWGQNWFCVY